MTPDVSPFDPKVVLRSLLLDHWDDPAVTEEYADRYDDFSWVIDEHFETSWIHTGWYDESSPYPQVTVTFDNSDPGTASGFDAITATGGKSSWRDNLAHIDTWVPSDRDRTDGINHKQYAWQLKLRCELIVLLHADADGDHPWNDLGIGEVRAPDEPDETPIGSRWRIPVRFSDEKRT